MKKVISLLITLMLGLTVVGCSNDAAFETSNQKSVASSVVNSFTKVPDTTRIFLCNNNIHRG